jgi:hypothetical protein
MERVDMPNEKSQSEAEETLRRWFPDAFKEEDAHRAKLKELFDFPIRRFDYGLRPNAANYTKTSDQSNNTED